MSVIVSDRRTLIVGLGKTGLSCVRYLCGQGRSVAVADSRQQPPGLDELRRQWPDVPVHLGEFDADLFAGFNELVVSPGISIATPAIKQAREKGAHIRGDIDLFSEAAKAPIVAITGSNGKTTVTTLVGEMARGAGVRVAVGGNIGTPALDLLADDVELYVLELSSFQLETTEELGAKAATILNVTDDHMDRYPTRMAYFQAKQRIYNGCEKAVINLDDALSQPMARDNLTFRCYGEHRINPDTFSLREDEGHLWITYGFDNLIRADELRLIGRHNLLNVMAALALGDCVGLPMEKMLEVARTFEGLPHRCQFVRTVNGVDYVNDSKGTNVGATVAALDSLRPKQGRLVLIAGGDGKGADFEPLKAPVRQSCRSVIVFGKDAGRLQDTLSGEAEVRRVADLAGAVREAAAVAVPGDRVLLSPACASLDMFSHYEARGAAFIEQVEALS
ncbi:UDP-N-acetylmuramoyl-L-alanine--D-glutamate ligase [Marinobacter halodurans]|uniref:UDP-N-acetylmuramoylalanine--D-glutamate ligase n=1 Tax=Marinobacter halodurans TaxID=2528979 RepID=A0ABY1ZKV3_9GAMM|nr:UDP-N-acetylmuramoyl-L-alanine--D-glutamate ligase [Marinobacter halodurans]TBW56256.1 UDP-N-acetylmuramoyl-L-alanine--D-glutamate ligase [Marinobacter halodurans]